MIQRIFITILLLFCSSNPVVADQWAPPQIEEVYSNSKEYLVKVIPGDSIGDTYGFAGGRKGGFARAEIFQYNSDKQYVIINTITLLNPIAPVDSFVSDFGYLITLDNWHNMGYGKIAALYSPEGKLIHAYELNDLFNKLERIPFIFMKSVSSIWWRKEDPYIRKDQKKFVVKARNWETIIFDIEKGSYTKIYF